MRKYLAALTTTVLLVGCGGSDGGGSADCLTPQQVQQRVNEIASGFETSDADVAAKQDEIEAVRARECK